MAFGIKLRVWGDYAAFNRPEMKVERVSYDVMTPSAARGVLTAIYWKPEMRWIIDEIRVLNPIRYTQVRRNEISCKISKGSVSGAMKAGRGQLGIAVDEYRQQRAASILRDVSYGIRAHIEVVRIEKLGDQVNGNSEAKHLEMFKRRATRGQYFHHPYLGVREFPASFELVENLPPGSTELAGTRDLGYMLHDLVYIPEKKGTVVDANSGERCRAEPRFFRATLTDGILQVPDLAEARG